MTWVDAFVSIAIAVFAAAVFWSLTRAGTK